MDSWFLALFLLLYGVHWLVDAGLLRLNLSHVRAMGAKVPPALQGQIDPATAGRSAEYTLARGRLALAEHVWDGALVPAVLLSGILPALDEALRSGAGALPPLSGLHLSASFLILLAGSGSLAGLPFSLYRNFGIERRFGFLRQSWRGWLMDRIKGLAVAAVLGIPLLYAALWLLERSGSNWWLWLFALLTGYQLLMQWLVPLVVMPLFNRFTPLPEGELRERVEALSRAAGFRIRGLYTMDASRRTGHSNAFFTGFGRAKRIVLFDTMLERMTPGEALAVLAHEIGHFRLRHVAQRVALGTAGTFALCYALSLLAVWPPLFQAFGFAAPSAHALLALLALGGGAFTFWLTPLASWYSRRHEFEADAFALRLAGSPGALKSALINLGGHNLSNLHPHPWYSRYYYSHPPLPERLAAIDRAAAAQRGGPERKAQPEAPSGPAA